MGLLGSIKKAASTVTKTIGTAAKKTIEVLNVGLAHPIKTAEAVISKEKTIQPLVEKHFSQSTPKQIKDVLVGSGGIAATVVGAGAASTAIKAGTLAPAAGKVITSLIPQSPVGKVAAGVGALVGIGAVLEQPKEAAKVVLRTPSGLINVGKNLADLGVQPTIANAEKLFKENPILVTAGLGAGALVAGKAVIPAAASLLQTESIQDLTTAIKETPYTPMTPTKTEVEKLPAEKTTTKEITTANAPTLPATTETTPLYATTGTSVSKRRKKRSIKPIIGSMSQKTNIIIQNNQNNKRYINRRVLLN